MSTSGGTTPDWLPYFGPMAAFALVLAVEEYTEDNAILLALRFAAPLASFLYFFLRGQYPELKHFRPGAGAILDILVGLIVMAIWIAPFMIWPELRPSQAEAFDPGAGATRPLMLVLRFLGFALMTPFIEELLVRSYLIRAVDVYPTDKNFQKIPAGTFAWRSFLFTLVWFTFTHATWEWPVAFVAGVIYNLWLYRRRHIGSLILAHAVTNAALFAFVIAMGQAKGFWDLWFFL